MSFLSRRLLVATAGALLCGCAPEMGRLWPDGSAVRDQRSEGKDARPREQSTVDHGRIDALACSWPGDVLGQKYPAAIVASGGSVYWADSDFGLSACTDCDGKIWRQDSAGRMELASSQLNVDAITVAGDRVYWAESADSGKVMARRKDLATLPVALAQNVYWAVGPVAHGNLVYWLTAGAAGKLMRHAGDTDSSTPPEELCAEQVEPTAIAVSPDGKVFWTAKNQGSGQYELRVYEKSCTTLGSLGSMTNPRGLIVDGAELFWVTPNESVPKGGEVWRMPIGGGAPQRIAASQARPLRVAAWGDQVFWSCSQGNELRWAKRGDSDQAGTVLASGQAGVFAVAADACHVYWTINSAAGAIRAISRP